MENQEPSTIEKQEPSTLKYALNAGALLGIVLMIVALIQSLLAMYDSKIFQFISYAVLIAGLLYAIKSYRDNELGGYITYGNIVGLGTLTALFAGIISGFIFYLYLKFVDDSMIAFIYSKAEQDMYDKNLSDEQIATSMEYMKSFTSAGMIALMSVLGNTFFGLVISLIAGIFLKKEADESLQAE